VAAIVGVHELERGELRPAQLDGHVQVEFEPRGDQALPVFRLEGQVSA